MLEIKKQQQLIINCFLTVALSDVSNIGDDTPIFINPLLDIKTHKIEQTQCSPELELSTMSASPHQKLD